MTMATESAAAERERTRVVLQVVQPGLLGLMDSAASTLAPLFAAATLTERARAAGVGACGAAR